VTDADFTNCDTDTEPWPPLRFGEWKDTCSTLHLWTQIVGKIRLAQSPFVNHWWQVALYVTVRGLTTSPIPHGARTFQIDFDFINHHLLVSTSDGAVKTMALHPRTVADFYEELFSILKQLDLAVTIVKTPNEVVEAIAFDRDQTHASYDAAYAERFWRALVQVDRVFKVFRGRYAGKCSPVHFFWGSFDMAVTRFSGRTAPMHPGGAPHCPDWVMHEAYSHELSSCGFWPGNEALPYPAFYAYAYPEPKGFGEALVPTPGAFYDTSIREFLLPYEVVRKATSPDALLLDFLQRSYEAAADLGHWDRAALEKSPR
jgi:Family of unknown function (DUF5996)